MRPDGADEVRGWLHEEGVELPAAGCGLAELLTALKRGGGQEFSDRWLTALLRRARSGSELAALMVVQAMSPSAMKSLRRLGDLAGDAGFSRDESAQLLVGTLFEVVRTYPLERRPHKVALNISWDTHQRASREMQREVRAQKATSQRTTVGQVVGPDPAAAAERALLADQAAEMGLGAYESADLTGARGELVDLLVWALRERVVGREGVQVLADHYREGALGDVEAARAAGVSAAAWRKRRSRVVQQLREAAPQWLAQAA